MDKPIGGVVANSSMARLLEFNPAKAETLLPVPVLYTKTPLPAVANARHGPGDGCAVRLDPWRFNAPFGHGQKPPSL
jgi:hypothetical protein